MGLGRVVPMILKDRGCSFSELGTYSLQSWPFSLKLLWAPLVDCLFIRRFGRRKTWMVPAQVGIGLLMMWSSSRLDDLLYGEKPAVLPLTLLFLSMNFLCATQDIAVDGWALTMLREENASYQATCNAAGQTFGFTLGFTGVTMLEQLEVTDLAGFMFYAGIFFVVVTVIVAAIKPEAPLKEADKPEGVVEAYTSIFAILQLKPVRTLIVVLFTWKLGFAVVDSVAPLKFQEYGVKKEYMTYMNSVLMPLEILLPIAASRWTAVCVAGLEPSMQCADCCARVYGARVRVAHVCSATTGRARCRSTSQWPSTRSKWQSFPSRRCSRTGRHRWTHSRGASGLR